VTQPITIRADTPREAVEEVCKWLEARQQSDHAWFSARYGYIPPEALLRATDLTFTLNSLRSATIEPKEPSHEPE
jgi:hypothetical protein